MVMAPIIRPSMVMAPLIRYRKHFHLPAEWKTDGGATFVHFEGVSGSGSGP